MKQIFKFILGVIFIGSGVYAQKVGNLFEVNVKGEQIEIKSNKMTYYFVNIVSPDGKTVSSPILVDRNNKKIKVDFGDLDIKWDGPIPDPSYSTPDQLFDFEQQTTDIEYPSNYYNGWKNSVLEFQGSSVQSSFKCRIKS